MIGLSNLTLYVSAAVHGKVVQEKTPHWRGRHSPVFCWKEGGLDNVYVRKNDGINSLDIAVASLDRFLTVGKHIQYVRHMSEELIPSFSRF
jgi:hypothetical protein